MSRRGSEGEDIIGRWSEGKLDLLAQYLQAYSTIMSNQKTSNNPTGKPWLRAYYYIDAFAGSVKPVAKDEQRYIDGSPLRALQTEPRFDGYWFIDVSPQRIERVERLREDFPDCIIETRLGDCNDVLRNDIIPKVLRSPKQRTFVFLDPYGLQVDWETVRELANTRTCDIFINFSVMGVTRLLPRDQNPEPEVVEQLSKVMGSTNWITQIYREPPATQLDLFGNPSEPSLSRDTIRSEWLASLYTNQLRELFRYVSRPVLMKNSTNSALYALCLASHNETAIRITNDIFNRYDQLRVLGS
ncbi:three-Cys-motif partner protein TcmP [Oscillatoria sp. FACHB-1407]|uniref:three-Cys-motif partner protein TcmP n=1 Tax=Oscillatoria sp. FACHB-1407 TaxID=2692847 RepID=UPI0016891F69|nr:three-Cys-motif partner protein TcmP [Oscillatoria sp. FACHB-1407]MBD2461927.1 three-Cys-motif partner protein TcmP [Oscillatoria sp. FACHB-1407]